MNTFMSQKFISGNLDFIEEQRSYTHRAIDEYVDKVLDAGRKWIFNNGRSQSSFSEICDKINKAVTFLNLKCEEIKCESLSVGGSENLEMIDSDDFPLQSKNLQMESVVENSDFASKFPLSSELVKRELNTDIEEEIKESGIKANKQNWNDTMYTNLEKQIQNVLAKQDDSDKKLDSKLAEFRKEVDSLNDEVRLINLFFNNGDSKTADFRKEVDSLNNEVSLFFNNGDSKLSKFRKEVDSLNNDVSLFINNGDSKLAKFRKEVDSLNNDVSLFINNGDSKLAKFRKEVDSLNNDVSLFINNGDSKLAKFRKEVDSLNKDVYLFCKNGDSKLAKIIKEVDSLNKDVYLFCKNGDCKLAKFRKEVDSLNNDVSSFFNNGEVLEDYSIKLKSLELINRNLSESVDKINEALQSLAEKQKEHDLLFHKICYTNEIEILLSSLEAQREDDQTKVKKQFEEVEAGFQDMCQLLVSRLQPLEQLRNILNNKVTARDNNIKQLHTVAAKLTEISKSVNQLEAKCPSLLVGFSAEALVHKGTRSSSVIRHFTPSICNDGVHFDKSTGVFIASENGIYMACVYVYQTDCSVHLIHRLKTKADGEYCVFISKTRVTGPSACHMGLIEMKQGDFLFARMEKNNNKVPTMIKFLCYRIA